MQQRGDDVGLFRPYERKTGSEDDWTPSATTPVASEPTGKRRQSMVIKSAEPTARARATETPAEPKPVDTRPSTVTEPTAASTTEARTRGPQPKAGPTPTRRQAEQARRDRLNPSLSPKESRQLNSANQREARMKAMAAAESAPEKALLRDYIDRRMHLGEFLLPACVVILALTFLSTTFTQIAFAASAVLYLFIFAVLIDWVFTWRGFKRLLAERVPNASTRGLLFYGLTRTTQIRRFRMPRPRVKRGAEI